MKNKISKWYKQNLWTKEMVADAVAKKVISADDYKEITGENYEEVA
jgi:hypothetical protein